MAENRKTGAGRLGLYFLEAAPGADPDSLMVPGFHLGAEADGTVKLAVAGPDKLTLCDMPHELAAQLAEQLAVFAKKAKNGIAGRRSCEVAAFGIEAGIGAVHAAAPDLATPVLVAPPTDPEKVH